MRSNKAVRALGLCNAAGLKKEIPTPWNLDLFEELLKGYHNQELFKYLRFGWPIELQHIPDRITELPRNQKGARKNVDRVNKYVSQEIRRGGVIGPFETNPLGLDARFSPLDAIPKKDSDDLQIIMNLSHPFEGGSVNNAINKDHYMGEPTDLSYPGIGEDN